MMVTLLHSILFPAGWDCVEEDQQIWPLSSLAHSLLATFCENRHLRLVRQRHTMFLLSWLALGFLLQVSPTSSRLRQTQEGTEENQVSQQNPKKLFFPRSIKETKLRDFPHFSFKFPESRSKESYVICAIIFNAI